jgi:glycerol kinase
VASAPHGAEELADFLLAIDQGTTSTRAIVFDVALTPVATAQREFRQIY